MFSIEPFASGKRRTTRLSRTRPFRGVSRSRVRVPGAPPSIRYSRRSAILRMLDRPGGTHELARDPAGMPRVSIGVITPAFHLRGRPTVIVAVDRDKHVRWLPMREVPEALSAVGFELCQRLRLQSRLCVYGPIGFPASQKT